MKTTLEALAILREAMPDRNHISVEKLACSSFTAGEYESYSISLQPGYDGTDCQLFNGENLNHVLAAALNAANDPDKAPSTE